MMTAAGGMKGMWIRRLARSTGTALAAFWLVAGIIPAAFESSAFTLEAVIMTALICLSAAGALIGWRSEGFGGAILVVVGLAHSLLALLAAGRNKGLAVLVSGVPFLIVGTLFLLYWRLAIRAGIDPPHKPGIAEEVQPGFGKQP
jgi:hypothetical protein